MRQKKSILSICISSYNHRQHCVKLVDELLRLNDDRIDIVVCDDCSTDGTVERLREIQNERLEVVQNKVNLGPCKNWYNTIDCGKGDYILHVLDRDILITRQLVLLVNILESRTDIVAGYAGKACLEKSENNLIDKSLYFYQKDKEALIAMGGIAVHPTGFFVKKNLWKELEIKQFFYNSSKYGIYPHSYVLAISALRGNMLYFDLQFYTHRYYGATSKSQFYTKEKHKNYYWEPESVIETSNKFVLELCKYIDESYIDEFIRCRFRTGLYRATCLYQATLGDREEMSHYGLSTRKVSRRELIWITVRYIFVFMHIVNKKGNRKYSLIIKLLEEIKLCLNNIVKNGY